MEFETIYADYKKLICPEPMGYLEHKATHSRIPVYKKINAFQALMMRVCFGLKFHKFK